MNNCNVSTPRASSLLWYELLSCLQSLGSKEELCRCCSSRYRTTAGNSAARKVHSLHSLINRNLMLWTQKVQFSESQDRKNYNFTYIYLGGFQDIRLICCSTVCQPRQQQINLITNLLQIKHKTNHSDLLCKPGIFPCLLLACCYPATAL